MQKSMETKKQKLQCRALCCSCRLSVSSSSEPESSTNSARYPSISSIAHAMVQERLDQMIKERQKARNDDQEQERRRRRRTRTRSERTKFVVMVAMEKSTYDPRKDFSDSIEQIIRANRISEPRDLRRLLDYYLKVNLKEYEALILQVFYDVCSSLFTSCQPHLRRED